METLTIIGVDERNFERDGVRRSEVELNSNPFGDMTDRKQLRQD